MCHTSVTNCSNSTDSKCQPCHGADVCVHVGPHPVRAVPVGARRRPHLGRRAPHVRHFLRRRRGQRQLSPTFVWHGRRRRTRRGRRQQVLPLFAQVPIRYQCFFLLFYAKLYSVCHCAHQQSMCRACAEGHILGKWYHNTILPQLVEFNTSEDSAYC